MRVLIIDDDEALLLRTLLHKHRDLTIAKIHFYELLDRNGEYHSSLEGYKKLRDRYNCLLKKLIYKENVKCGIK